LIGKNDNGLCMTSTSNRSLNIRHFAVSALLGMIAAAITLVLGIQIVIVSEQKALEDKAVSLVEILVKNNIAREAIFKHVKTLNGDLCSPAALMDLRQQLYRYHNIRDVVVFEAEKPVIECSALAGPLARPFQLTGTPRRNNVFPERRAWNEPALDFLPDDKLHHLVRDGRFGIIIDSHLMKEAASEFDWQLYVRKGDGQYSHHVYGNKELHSEFEKNDTLFGLSGKLISRACLGGDGYLCILVGRPVSQVIGKNRLTLVPGVILAAVAGLLGYRITRQAYASGLSTKGRIINAYRSADKKGFHCHYQPIVELATGRIVGCEVLARFKDRIGTIPPIEFIPIIEQAGNTWDFTETVMHRISEDFEALPVLPADFRVSINVYPADLDDDNFDRLQNSKVLNDLLQLGPKIVCEILETGFADSRSPTKALQYLKNSGVVIAIDDFGTGFSNLQQLKTLDADYLKIDKSFVDEISVGNGYVEGTFIPHIVSLATENKIDVIAEGIETAEQAPTLAKLGARFGQGYFFARPLPLQDFKALLKRNHEALDHPTSNTLGGFALVH
jgi:sensor c-di-GMP phosphodiesterase-like protein